MSSYNSEIKLFHPLDWTPLSEDTVSEEDVTHAYILANKIVNANQEEDGRLISFVREHLQSCQSNKSNEGILDQAISAFHDFTPLHIAVLRNHPQLVKALLEMHFKATAEDEHGWKPIHHAALVSKELFDLFRKQQPGADQIVNRMGVTASELRMMAGLVAEEPKKLFLCQSDGTLKQLDAKGFKELTGHTYGSYNRFKNIQLLWKQQPVSESGTNFNKLLKLTCHKMATNPRALSIGHSKTLEGKDCGLTVYAEEAIPAGTAVTVYSGIARQQSLSRASFEKQILAKDSASTYLINGGVDAKEYGSGAEFINEGFPMLMNMGMTNFKGVESATVLYAIAPIAKGQELLWDYGPDHPNLKWGNYVISDESHTAMDDFWREDKLSSFTGVRANLNELFNVNPALKKKFYAEETILEEADLKNFDMEKLFDPIAVEQRVQYSLSTPAATIDLMLNNLLTPEKIKAWRAVKFTFDATSKSTQHFAWMESLQTLLGRVQGQLNTLPQPLADRIRQQLCGMLKTHTVLQTCQAIYDTHTWLLERSSETPALENLWEEWHTQQKERWDTFEWDKAPDFCFQRTAVNPKKSSIKNVDTV